MKRAHSGANCRPNQTLRQAPAEPYRGYAGDRWPYAARGQRTVLFFGGKLGSVPRLLDSLTDEEVAAKLPVHLRYLPDAAAA
jgi:hypothetical protein